MFKVVDNFNIRFFYSLLEALSTGSAFGREQKKRRGHRPAGGKYKYF